MIGWEVMSMTGNEATIASGVLSMAGGIIGAIGAYCAAKHQMKKTKSIDDVNRLVDLKIMKLDETIGTFNDLKYLINSTDGYIKDINIIIALNKENGHTHIGKNEIKTEYIENLESTWRNIEQIVNRININKWYIKNQIDMDEFYEIRSAYSQVLKKYNATFSSFKSKESIRLTKEFDSMFEVCIRAYDEKYKIFIDFIEKVILNLELEIEKVL